jgi:hypothetical protein
VKGNDCVLFKCVVATFIYNNSGKLRKILGKAIVGMSSEYGKVRRERGIYTMFGVIP